MSPFKQILRLSSGDFLAKTLNFLVFVHLARTLGVESYGVLEFALSMTAYFLLIADGGLELIGTRATAQGENLLQLASRIIPLRLLLSSISFIALLAIVGVLPEYPGLQPLLLVFGLTLFVQAVNLKWAFMGTERLGRVAVGLVVGQVIFSVAVFALVREPADVILIPIARIGAELIVALYFGRRFVADAEGFSFSLSVSGAGEILKPALAMGFSSGLAMMMFNFDTVLLGFMSGSKEVGWYGAAYKPVTAALLVPVTYFLGIFPALSRTYSRDRKDFRALVSRSLSLTALFAVPLAVVGSILAAPIVDLLFGTEYANAVPAMQILCWSAALVILRGTYRQALNAANRQRLDLACALTAVSANVLLNLLLIPRYGIIGAAAATVAAEVIWLTAASLFFHRHVSRINLLPHLRQPLIGAALLAIFLLLTPQLFWPARALLGGLIYLSVLILIGETEVRSWLQFVRPGAR